MSEETQNGDGGGSGWKLSDLTDWLGEQIKSVWDSFVEFMGDLLVMAVETATDVVVAALDLLPVPDFITTYSICGLLNQAGPLAAWVVSTFRVSEGLLIVAAAIVFRLLRVVLTLFQWS